MRILLFIALLISTPLAAQEFVVEEIRVDGLQRISEGTVFSFLPVEVDEVLTPSLARSSIRDLYRTGFFDEISLAREGNILIITVTERPAISAVNITGNRKIDNDALLPVLADIGISEGEVFDELALDQIQQELVRQYFSQGHYAVEVDTQIIDLDRNRVNISITVEENDPAKIRHLNIVGNTAFTEKELREDFESDTRRGLFFWRGRTNYTREKLSGDLERLRAFYLDRGFADFAIESTQVSISPNKQNIYITANIREGEVYTVDEVQLTGDLILEESTLRQLVLVEQDATFSRQEVEQSIENITSVMANFGYAFANVSPVPRIDRENKRVSLNFFVDPGKRVFVRRVEFRGNLTSKDEVLRREMRQFEGAWFSQSAIDRSRLRLQRIGYFDNVNIETPAVEGTEDQIDVIVSVEERSSGNFQVGLGFSQLQGLILSASIQQENFLGSGRSIGFGVSRSDIQRSVNISYNNPFWTDDGVSRGFFVNFSEFDQRNANLSDFSTSQGAAGVNFGFPVTEVDFLRFGGSFQRLDINIGRLVNIREDPDDPTSPITGTALEATRPLAITLDTDGDGFLSRSEREVDSFILDGSWARDTRNHFLTPTRGSLNQLSLEVAVPGSTREYYRVSYRGRKFWPLFNDMAFSLRGDLSYGDSYDGEDNLGPPLDEPLMLEPGRRRDCQLDEVVATDGGLPFWQHFVGGGVSDIRGFDDNSLGPKNTRCESVGGDFKVVAGAEIAFPIPFVDLSGTRLAWFVDVGNVFQDVQSFDQDLLRASTGLSLTWQAPIGPLIINLSVPLRERDGDETQALQFSFGGQF